MLMLAAGNAVDVFDVCGMQAGGEEEEEGV